MARKAEEDVLQSLLDCVEHPERDATLKGKRLTEVRTMRALLGAIDQSWRFVDQAIDDRIRALTIAKLQEIGAPHSWAMVDEVRTLGELVRATGGLDELVPPGTLLTLEADTTAVDDLVRDPATRQRALLASFQHAAVPQAAAQALFKWIIEALADLVNVPAKDTFVYARRQRLPAANKVKRGPRTSTPPRN